MLIDTAWSAELVASFAALGFVGSALMDFTDAVAGGSVDHVVGQPFATTDAGSVSGGGVGAGVGIVGISDSLVSSSIFADSVASFGQAGSRLQDMCDAIGSALVSQMGLATLSSTHAPVFAGSGMVTPGSIPVVGPAWGSAIEGAAPSFMGSEWGNFASAIGNGCASAFTTATGVVAIAGSPSGDVSGGAGVGSGTIS